MITNDGAAAIDTLMRLGDNNAGWKKLGMANLRSPRGLRTKSSFQIIMVKKLKSRIFRDNLTRGDAKFG
jgi:hypothetical protein